ncbi:hypothetical protein [Oceanobacillus neutriphilus]|uniref:Uncharacterized protein n=1 Tax=Oceanobacillus neutriphilus TaxID=531815 RepID=A0ABQ2NMV2_9BACI|nr:hypothetical protein [Oceanobacillus neutriphilus]GGP07348.1 hypothetical protein GCM10011346_02980 [Oceanobacillus neutriphilus]
MLSDHYKTADLPLVMKEVDRIFQASQKAFSLVETAQFERKEDLIFELQGAFENLVTLNQKKLNAEAIKAINEDTRRNMF